MKITDPKTGKEIKSVAAYRWGWCGQAHRDRMRQLVHRPNGRPRCDSCPLSFRNSNYSTMTCEDFCRRHPDEAAKVMGLAVSLDIDHRHT